MWAQAEQTTARREPAVSALVVLEFLSAMASYDAASSVYWALLQGYHHRGERERAGAGDPRRQGLTLVHFSAQPEPFFVTEPLKLRSVSLTRCLR